MQLLGGSALHFADLLPERVQTHHGVRDTIVPVGNARALGQALMRRSDMITSEYFEYRFGVMVRCSVSTSGRRRCSVPTSRAGALSSAGGDAPAQSSLE